MDALTGYPDQTDLVIRRRERLEIYWYTFRVGDIRSLARYKPEKLDVSLRESLDLHEGMASGTYAVDVDSPKSYQDVSGVLLDGEDVLGVLEPEPKAAAVRSTRGGGVSAAVHQALPSSFPKEAAPAKASTPFSAYPRLEAPDNVAPKQKFELIIGLSLEQQAGVAGGKFTLVTAEDEFDLIVQVMAPEFEAPNGIRRFLHVDRTQPQKAEARVTLIAPATDAELLLSHLEVEFTYEGHLLARAWREIRVVSVGTAPPAEPVKTTTTGLAVAPEVEAPDLQVTINTGIEETSLEWLFTSPLDVMLPEGKVLTTLKGKNAQSFALNEIKTVAEKDGTKFIDEQILGIARHISDVIPLEFWNVLDQVWKRRNEKNDGRAPSLLVVSSEAYIPWELASTEEDWIDPALIDPNRPPLMGAQLRVGRWIPPGPKRPRGVQRPALPPAHTIEIGRMALVIGDYYAENGQRPLPLAKEEGKTLALRYETVPLTATENDLNLLLSDTLQKGGQPVAVSSLHFACHGEVDPTNHRYNGIVLSEKAIRLSPNIVSGSKICQDKQPFVFLNACQLGFSSELLADYGGMAGEFLRAGSRGFMAPLWSIDDQLAHDIAINFYERTLDDGIEVGEVMRDVRSKFDLTQDIPSSTFVAYIFYGHPSLILRRPSTGTIGG
ncbi:MAG: CHAT domain-containing protein [Deltaproteobacteria bacterium]|nr:CHAT domain-containing protein [Deltaproteobacteria bacterium]